MLIILAIIEAVDEIISNTDVDEMRYTIKTRSVFSDSGPYGISIDCSCYCTMNIGMESIPLTSANDGFKNLLLQVNKSRHFKRSKVIKCNKHSRLLMDSLLIPLNDPDILIKVINHVKDFIV